MQVLISALFEAESDRTDIPLADLRDEILDVSSRRTQHQCIEKELGPVQVEAFQDLLLLLKNMLENKRSSN